MKKTLSLFAIATIGSAFAYSLGPGLSGLFGIGSEPVEVEFGDHEDGPVREPSRVTFPCPKDAKLESEFFAEVAAPFYRKHVVETYDAAAETNEAVRTRVLKVREELARHLTVQDLSFPRQEALDAANEVWHMGCHDAAAAFVRYVGNGGDFRYWNGEEMFSRARKALDPKREPILAMLLERQAFNGIKEHHERWPNHKPESLVSAAYKLYDASFNEDVVRILKDADPRIAEWMDMDEALPVGSAEKLGNEYLGCCQRAKACKDEAFASRGTGWASEVTAEGWKGWEANNGCAESNLLRAVELKPDRARPALMLADLYGRSCSAGGDPLDWFNRGVSNSLDEAARCASGAVHFQMARWGGGRNGLRDIVLAATTNVSPESVFAVKVAAQAVKLMIEYNNEGDVREEVYKRVIDSELRARLYAMFDTYIAAGERPYAPRPDMYRQAALTLAMLLEDWDKARKYRGEMTAGVKDEWEQYWVRTALAREETVFRWNLMDLLGELEKSEALRLIDAEQALAEGRYADAAAFYLPLLDKPKRTRPVDVTAGSRGFLARLRSDQAKGGWVDLTPTASCGEAFLFWGRIGPQADGWVRKTSDWRSHYMTMYGLPGIGSVFEATVRFERSNPNQKEWHLSWGWARPYTCQGSSWAYPEISFSRDESGDHVLVASLTQENRKNKPPQGKELFGTSPEWAVYTGDLEQKDEHGFRATFEETGGDFIVEIDGKEVYRRTMKSLMALEGQNDRVQPNGNVFPVWKLYDGTAFRNYRYRRLKDQDH